MLAPLERSEAITRNPSPTSTTISFDYTWQQCLSNPQRQAKRAKTTGLGAYYLYLGTNHSTMRSCRRGAASQQHLPPCLSSHTIDHSVVDLLPVRDGARQILILLPLQTLRCIRDLTDRASRFSRKTRCRIRDRISAGAIRNRRQRALLSSAIACWSFDISMGPEQATGHAVYEHPETTACQPPKRTDFAEVLSD